MSNFITHYGTFQITHDLKSNILFCPLTGGSQISKRRALTPRWVWEGGGCSANALFGQMYIPEKCKEMTKIEGDGARSASEICLFRTATPTHWKIAPNILTWISKEKRPSEPSNGTSWLEFQKKKDLLNHQMGVVDMRSSCIVINIMVHN